MLSLTGIFLFSIGLTHSFPYDPEYVQSEEIDQEYYREDDMIFPIDRAGRVGNNWPGGVVPFVIDDSVYDYPKLLANIRGSQLNISTTTCIQFTELTDGDTHGYWLLYWVDPNEPTCSSNIGFQNLPNQKINLSPDCTRGNLVHETIHALGFLHEHTRDDRDDYVTVVYENVKQTPINFTHNFIKDGDRGFATNYYNVPYNYESIMHYGRNGFSVDPSDPSKNTIVSLNNPKAIGNANNMGQRRTLTRGDIQMIRNKYRCPSINEQEDASVELEETEIIEQAVIPYTPTSANDNSILTSTTLSSMAETTTKPPNTVNSNGGESNAPSSNTEQSYTAQTNMAQSNTAQSNSPVTSTTQKPTKSPLKPLCNLPFKPPVCR